MRIVSYKVILYYSKKKWVVSKFVKYFKIRWFCVEKVKIEALKGKIFNFNENNENHKVSPSAKDSIVYNIHMWMINMLVCVQMCEETNTPMTSV
jgi:hypothetical protein